MTTLLKEAFDKVTTLPEPLQDQIAHQLLEEVEWDKTFSESQDVLDRLAQKALDEFESGKTHELGFDDL